MEEKNACIVSNKVTIVVNSCDGYEDLWYPFFTLLKKYWKPLNERIVLNTESKNYQFDGLNIECFHPSSKNSPYGKRMLEVLEKISTPYVLMLLDDFFLRKPVDINQIYSIINWMDKDENIAYFNCDNTPVYYEEWEKDKYPGYHRIPYGNIYTLNMQAAIWRTSKLKKYWSVNSEGDISPWEWEMYTNAIISKCKKDKFYCKYNQESPAFCEYGHSVYGDIWGVVRGKWVESDIVSLFNKEHIEIDLKRRGFFQQEKGLSEDCISEIRNNEMPKTIRFNYSFIERVLGKPYVKKYKRFINNNDIIHLFRISPETVFAEYCLYLDRCRFKKKLKREERIKVLKSEKKTKIIKKIIHKLLKKNK